MVIPAGETALLLVVVIAKYLIKRTEMTPLDINLAHRMLHLMLASLIRKFDWELDGEMRPKIMDMSKKFGMTFHKSVPLVAIPIKI
ncbi:hypothetical protein OSB04_009190 [Centaurea solstitialis]|uniref:Cytochrome P450 n=1 Tax=Centaurea solstitialis TaxID=347529 RepID=A0AA38TN72_9ASTR|nr:hypothetical protein OSB04_009190 [Centaurea solstitialis]